MIIKRDSGTKAQRHKVSDNKKTKPLGCGNKVQRQVSEEL